MAENSCRILIWNAEWATARSPRGKAISSILFTSQADVICLTEGCRELLPSDGRVIESGADYGYEMKEGRRKVRLWNRRERSFGEPAKRYWSIAD